MRHKVGKTAMQSGTRKDDLNRITKGHCGSSALQKQEWMRKTVVGKE